MLWNTIYLVLHFDLATVIQYDKLGISFKLVVDKDAVWVRHIQELFLLTNRNGKEFILEALSNIHWTILCQEKWLTFLIGII